LVQTGTEGMLSADNIREEKQKRLTVLH